MRYALQLWLLTAAVLSTAAAADDPMESVQCRQARAELDSALSSATNNFYSASRLARARSAASRECLGSVRAGPERKRAGAPQPAQAVPLPRIEGAPPTPLPPPPPPATPSLVPGPGHVTQCDPTGCWDSEGRRLNQVGPLLVGPRGPCSLQGSIVNCP